MPQTVKIAPRVLIIENVADQSRAMELSIMAASHEAGSLFGVDQFTIDKAFSIDGAMKFLDTDNSRYDICLLDLSLPEYDDDVKEDKRGGHRILHHIFKTGNVKKVIVISGFGEYKNIMDAVHSGAVDFIRKPFDKSGLQTQILMYLKQIIRDESEVILDQRIKELVPYAEQGLIYQFSSTFSHLVNSLSRTSDEIERYAKTRYGIDVDRDPHDSLIRQLVRQKESIKRAKTDWIALQADLSEKEEVSKTESIADILDRINRSILPCLAAKKSSLAIDLPDNGRFSVLTFKQDVHIILKELLLGGLSEQNDFREDNKISVSAKCDDTRCILSLEDNFSPLSTDIAEKINEGYAIISDLNFGRKWGLSVAQHIAQRGGGEIEVKPKSNGNVIKYQVPLAYK